MLGEFEGLKCGSFETFLKALNPEFCRGIRKLEIGEIG
jgi:hypothetical protein